MMTKNQKMLLGVGAVAVVGYLVYKQMNKSKGFAQMQQPRVFSNATGMTSRAKALVPFSIPCPKGYLNNTPHTLDGQTVYECTGPTGTGGVYTTVPPKGATAAQNRR